MSLVNVCFFALLLIVEPLDKRPRTFERKAAVTVAAVMLGMNLWWWLK